MTPEYINTVLFGDYEQEAMQLSNQVTIDVHCIPNLSLKKSFIHKTNVCFNREDQKQKKKK